VKYTWIGCRREKPGWNLNLSITDGPSGHVIGIIRDRDSLLITILKLEKLPPDTILWLWTIWTHVLHKGDCIRGPVRAVRFRTLGLGPSPWRLIFRGPLTFGWQRTWVKYSCAMTYLRAHLGSLSCQIVIFAMAAGEWVSAAQTEFGATMLKPREAKSKHSEKRKGDSYPIV
jgi:hypothetical protein